MSITVNTNIASLLAQQNLNNTQGALQTSLQRLSTGLRINSAADDAAGYAISTRMTSQLNGYNQATNNANDGISLTQTALGAMNGITSQLQSLRNLAVQSANATNSSGDRANLQVQAKQVLAEIDRLAQTTQFNGNNLLDGSFTGQNFQIGPNAGNTVTVSSISNMQTKALGDYTEALTSTAANAAITAGSLFINGTAVNATAAGANTAADVASAINASNISGVTAKASYTDSNALSGITLTASASASASYSLTINGKQIENQTVASGGGTANISSTQLVNDINNAGAGVSAALDTNGKLVLTSTNGSNINVTQSGTNSTGGLGTANGTTATAAVSVAAANNTVTITGTSALSFTGSGATAFTTGATSGGTQLNTLDLSTATGATGALSVIDAALNSVSTQSATLGALQNRFTSVVNNLQTASQNLSSARSRIQDADFAAETANYSKEQILSQAGTAMVAQANTLPQSALTLISKLG